MEDKIQEGLRLDMPDETVEVEEPKVEAQEEAVVESDTELTPEALEGQETSQEEVVEPTEPEIAPYTPEEVEALLRDEDPDKVDFRRLSPEGQAIFKSVDRGLKPKLEERAQLLKDKERLDAIERTVGAQKQEQPTIEQEFERNPQGVLANIRHMIAEKEATDPFGTEISQLRNAHAYFIEKLTLGQAQEVTHSRARQEAYSAVTEMVPDFNPEELTEFAVNDLGISNETLAVWTDGAQENVPLGVEGAAMVTSLLHRLHVAERKVKEMSQGVSVEQKEVKTPTPVESAGSGFEADKPTEWSAQEAIMDKRKQTLR